jgi:hypothetical protein
MAISESYLSVLVNEYKLTEQFITELFFENDTPENRLEFSCDKVKNLAQELLDNNEGARPSARRRLGFGYSDEIDATASLMAKSNKGEVVPRLEGIAIDLRLIGIFDNIREIAFDDIQGLEGVFPKSLQEMSSLRRLTIIHCGLTELPHVARLPVLDYLDLSHNEIAVVDVDKFREEELERFILSENPISRENSDEIAKHVVTFISSHAGYVNGESMWRVVS